MAKSSTSADGGGDDRRKTFELRVRSPEGLLFVGPIVALRLPGVDGHLGVLANHAPMLAALSCGVMHIVHPDEQRESMAIGEGFAQVSGNVAKLTIHFMDHPLEINQDRAHRAMGRALTRLRKEVDDQGWDVERAEASLCRALARLSACGCGCNMCYTATSVASTPVSRSIPGGTKR